MCHGGGYQGAPTTLSRSGFMGLGLLYLHSKWDVILKYKDINKIKLKYKENRIKIYSSTCSSLMLLVIYGSLIWMAKNYAFLNIEHIYAFKKSYI